jgi:hypothetical protein
MNNIPVYLDLLNYDEVKILFYFYKKIKKTVLQGGRVVKRMIPDHISYPHPHFFPDFCLNLRKKGMKNSR